jgi:hypothetical protein
MEEPVPLTKTQLIVNILIILLILTAVIVAVFGPWLLPDYCTFEDANMTPPCP